MAKRKNSSSSRRQSAKRRKEQMEFTCRVEGVILITIVLLGAFQLGALGSWIARIMMYLFGKAYWAMFVPMAVSGWFLLAEASLPDVSGRLAAGISVAFLTTLLWLAIPADRSTGQAALQAFIDEGRLLLRGEQADAMGGLLGGLLYFLVSSMCDLTGTYIIIALLYILAAALCIDPKTLRAWRKRISDSRQYAREKGREIAREKEEQKAASISRQPRPSLINLTKEPAEENPSGSAPEPVILFPQKSEQDPYPQGSFDLDLTKEKEAPAASDVNGPEYPVEEEEGDAKSEQEKWNALREGVRYNDYASYHLPSIGRMLDPSSEKKSGVNQKAAQEKGDRLIGVLAQFSIPATLVNTYIGPSVTKFVIRPDASVNVNRIVNIQDNIKMELAARTIRIEAPIPGMRGVGVEIPNAQTTTVHMRDLFSRVPEKFRDKPLMVGLGKDLFDTPVFCDLDKMPHLLVAGATGSGKSVCMNAIICSLLLRQSPAAVKLLLIDPKKVEFSEYKEVPHLIGPVISEPRQASRVLQEVVHMMEQRYQKFAGASVKNLAEYNKWVDRQQDKSIRRLPYIVVIIDELADLMLAAGKEVEGSIQRITQLARAAGIHLIVATQRPSTDVITGVIKANIPSRISFAVTNGIDSKVILDQTGAENLLGNGDMLYKPQGITPKRLQGVFVTDEEVKRITSYVCHQAKPCYADEIYNALASDEDGAGGFESAAKSDPMYPEVEKFVISQQRASTSLIQRRFGFGYNRAAQIMDQLQQKGIVGPPNGAKGREILVKPDGTRKEP